MTASYSIADRALDLWTRWSTPSEGFSRDEKRLYSSSIAALTILLLAFVFYTILFAFWGVWPLVASSAVGVLVCMVVLAAGKQGRYVLSTWLNALTIIVSITFAIIFIGWGFGAQYAIFTTFMITAMNPLYGRRTILTLAVVEVLAFIGWYYYSVRFQPLYAPPPWQMAAFNVFHIVTTFAVIGATARQLLMETDRANQATEDLLNNVLPGPIATRLKQEPATIADGFDNASILFADIAGFTPVSQSLTPEELVEMLDEIFSEFDDLVDQYGLEKIKTIGDEYMVASGIPIPRDDHAEALAHFALAMRDSLANYREENGVDLQMRIGLNSGPVVAGVIGKRRFLYDLWGDSVNTASRMESHGIPGEIQVTQATRDLLDGTFHFVKRGMIDVKGKGPMPTYLLQAHEQ